MRILQIIQRDQRRGAEIFCCQLTRELIATGWEVDLLVLFGLPTGSLDFPVQPFFLQANENRRWADLKAYSRLSKFINSHKYDIVQSNAADTLKYAVLSKLLFGWNSKLVFRNANQISSFINNIVKKVIYKVLLSKVDSVASVSEVCRQDFIQTFKYPAGKTATLTIGVPVDIKKPYPSFNSIGLHCHGPVLLHAGGFVLEKNHVGVLRIFSEVLKVYPDAHLFLAGEGKLMGQIKDRIQQNNLNRSITLIGSRHDLNQIMSLCDVFILPSIIEGLPAVVLEAFNARLPVVAYDVGGIGEVVKDGITGYLIDRGNEKEFIKKVLFILQFKSEQTTENAKKLINDFFTIPSIALKFSEFYKSIN